MIAIDLGTTHSLVAVWQDGAARLIPNALGEVLTPSAVFVDAQGTLLVGRAARDRWLAQPERGAVAFKRHMGTQRRLQLGPKALTAEDLSALVLRSLKEDAERFLGQPVEEAVITVPAYFGNAQREATRLAGELAGLKVRRLLNEPTAAALAYGLQEAAPESRFLVLDLGGGTFDVSLLELFEGVMEVHASAGDNHLGGEDFVQALVQGLLQRWPELPPPEAHPLLQAQLWREAERVKRALSLQGRETATVQWLERPFSTEVSQDDLAQWCAPLLERLRRPIERALRDAQLSPDALDQVVLAGGATRMPLVRQTVARLLGRLPAVHLNPDEVIAQGAAVMAGLLARDAALDDMVMTDVCPFSLGTSVGRTLPDGSCLSGLYAPILERNTPVPVSRVERYVSARDQQRAIVVDIYQGEALHVKDNTYLGEVEVPIPPRPAGEVAVDVRFTYDACGVLAVDVSVPLTGEQRHLVLQQGSQTLSPEQVQARLAQLQSLKVHPRDQAAHQALLAQAHRLHEELLGADRRQFAEHLLRFEAALDQQDTAAITHASGALQQALRHWGGNAPAW